MKHYQLQRRTFLRGLGTSIALPMLEAMLPTSAVAKASGKVSPLRLALLYVPNGIHMPDWTPKQLGSDLELPKTLAPLEGSKDHLLVLSGLAHDKAWANGDGPGDHARSASTFLTARQAYKTAGANIRIGISVDQLAAQKVGKETKLPSLELGCEQGKQAGSCDSGYSCAYSSNISWRTPSSPMPKEIDPRVVFERLFGNEHGSEVAERQAKRDRYHKSILDFVLAEARQLQTELGARDQQKLEEYLTSVREIERRIDRTERVTPSKMPDNPVPAGLLAEYQYQERLRLMCDMIVLAFQADLTRIVTFMFANAGSNRSYQHIGVPEGHHSLSHHRNDEQKKAKIQQINEFHVTHLSYLLEKLKAVSEPDGSLLDHSMIVYGCSIGDGNRHNHNDLPFLLAGKAGGALQTGRHIRYPENTPVANLYLSVLDLLGVHEESFGDSTDRLTQL